MAKKLHYHNFNGLAESIRYILHYTKQEYEVMKHDFESCLEEVEDVDSHTLNHCILYKEGERILKQALVIAKYVARDTDLIPVDPWVQAVVETAVYHIYEYWTKVVEYINEKDPEKKEEIKKKLLEETIDYFFSTLEKHLNEHGGYLGLKLSWAEFVLCGIVEASNLSLGIELENKYPAVKAIVEKIKGLPGVKEYVAARGPIEIKE